MPIYRVRIEGRHKTLLIKEESAAKAKERVVTATALTADEMSSAIEDGERVWKVGEPFPADEAPDEDATEIKDEKPPVSHAKAKAGETAE